VTRYLLDTNVISELRKPRPHGSVVQWIEHLQVGQILVSVVTLGELQSGIELTRKQDRAKAIELESWVNHVESSFSFLPMNGACFREWRRLMVGKGDALREDAMIAATARIHGLTVATRNEADFQSFSVPIFNPFKPSRTQ
jgi:predicted nucleic acid-binding protein